MYSRNDFRSYQLAAPNELYHRGVKGMKWHVRRYQNEDGSLTALGREHYGYGEARRTKGTGDTIDVSKRIMSEIDNGYAEARDRSIKAAELEKKANKLQKRINSNQIKSNNLNIKLNKKAVDAAKLDTKLLKLDSDDDKFVKVNEKLNKTDAKVAKIDTEIRKLDKTIKKDTDKLAKIVAKRDTKISDLSEEEIAFGRAEMERLVNLSRNEQIGFVVGAIAGAVAGSKIPAVPTKAAALVGGAVGGLTADIATRAVDTLTGKTARNEKLDKEASRAYARRVSDEITKKYAKEIDKAVSDYEGTGYSREKYGDGNDNLADWAKPIYKKYDVAKKEDRLIDYTHERLDKQKYKNTKEYLDAGAEMAEFDPVYKRLNDDTRQARRKAEAEVDRIKKKRDED